MVSRWFDEICNNFICHVTCQSERGIGYNVSKGANSQPLINCNCRIMAGSVDLDPVSTFDTKPSWKWSN